VPQLPECKYLNAQTIGSQPAGKKSEPSAPAFRVDQPS
jgi:hypothetical protein